MPASDETDPDLEQLRLVPGEGSSDERVTEGGHSLRHALAEFGHLALGSSSITTPDRSQSSGDFAPSMSQALYTALTLKPTLRQPSQLNEVDEILASYHSPSKPVSPTRETTSALFEIYKSIILPRFPYMDASDLDRYYSKSVSHQMQLMPAGGKEPYAYESFLVYMAIATAAFASASSPRIFDFGTQLFTSVTQHLPDLTGAADPQVTVQCLTALALGSLYNPHQGSPWYLLGIAVAGALSSGMHRWDDARLLDTEAQRNSESERLLQTLYILDRLRDAAKTQAREVSHAFDRPPALSGRELCPTALDRPRVSESHESPDTALLQGALDYLSMESYTGLDWTKPDFYYIGIANALGASLPLRKAAHSGLDELTLRLRSRFLVDVWFKRALSRELQSQAALAGSSLARESVMNCKDWLCLLSEKVRQNTYVLSILDAYEIAGAGALSAWVQRYAGFEVVREVLRDCTRIDTLCASMLGYLSARFDAAKVLGSLLDELKSTDSWQASQEVQRIIQPNLTDIPKSYAAPVPRRMREMLHACRTE
ncbi:hypothetical protein D0861_04719 [Hortaea werneckii]|uniref:Xylanolytic transcriptional activator regulatory domain-containing protein n=1 Tax=Hortaea werneckii TaxID=91943 RepID=A0A3M7FJ03_HORWE|nr:hypothetical protein D0861_04719 [Hortaea werneckii]